jgi:hypothetical protein
MKQFSTLLLLIFFTTYLTGQKKQEDFGIWYGSEFSYKLAKGTYLVGSFSIRTADNATSIRRFHYEIGAEKKFFKQVVVGLKYRNRFLYEYDGNEVNNRFLLDISNKQKLGKFGLQLRSRTQYTFGANRSNIDERIRLKLDYQLEDNIKVYIYDEFFFRLNNNKGTPYSGFRFGFGAKYEFNEKLALDIGYLRSSEFNTKSPEILNVFQAELNVNF